MNISMLPFPEVLYHQSDIDDPMCPHNRQLGFRFLPFSHMHNFGSRNLTMHVPLRSMVVIYFTDWQIFSFPHKASRFLSYKLSDPLPHILLQPTAGITSQLEDFRDPHSLNYFKPLNYEVLKNSTANLLATLLDLMVWNDLASS
jgi:hypothetical protein